MFTPFAYWCLFTGEQELAENLKTGTMAHGCTKCHGSSHAAIKPKDKYTSLTAAVTLFRILQSCTLKPTNSMELSPS
jgi:hypothetical protein